MSPRREAIEMAPGCCPPYLNLTPRMGFPAPRPDWAHSECGVGKPPFDAIALLVAIHDRPIRWFLCGSQGKVVRDVTIRHEPYEKGRTDSALYDQMEAHLEMAHGFTSDHFPPLHMIRHAYVRAAVALLMD